LQKHITQKYAAATDDFYQASLLCPRELAFNLNLLQGSVDADLIFYKKVNTLEFLTELQNRELNEGNRKHLEEIVSLTIKKKMCIVLSIPVKVRRMIIKVQIKWIRAHC
jgi:hypothetical protein